MRSSFCARHLAALVTRIDQQPSLLMVLRVIRLARTPFEACQTRLTTTRVEISGGAAQYYDSCSCVGCAFSRDHLIRFRYALSSLIRRTGMPESTMPTLFRELRPPNKMSENSECARLRDSLRVEFADLEFGIVFHCSTAGIEAVWKWNLH